MEKVMPVIEESVTSESIAGELKRREKKVEEPAPVTPKRCPVRCLEVDGDKFLNSSETPESESRPRSAECERPIFSRTPSCLSTTNGPRFEPVSDMDYVRFQTPLPCSPLNGRLLDGVADPGFSVSLADCVIYAKTYVRACLRGQDVTQCFPLDQLADLVAPRVSQLAPKMAGKFGQLWLDLIVLHALKTPDLDETLLHKVVSIFGSVTSSSTEPVRPFWCRHLVFLENATERGWANWERLFLRLLRAEMVNTDNLEADTVSLLAHSWSPETLKRLGGVLTRVSQCPEVRSKHNVELLDWVAWFCSEEPDDPDF
jgi:hypothetical protein